MDYYTIKTSVDISDDIAFSRLVACIGFFTQPMVLGAPHAEDGSFVFRFAVRDETLRAHEDELLSNLEMESLGFTSTNTEIVRAARL